MALTAPPDVKPGFLWTRREHPGGYEASGIVNPDRNDPLCRVYWGSHGCERPKGHEGDHWCDCCDCEDHPDDSGCVAGPPYYGAETRFYGEDAA